MTGSPVYQASSFFDSFLLHLCQLESLTYMYMCMPHYVLHREGKGRHGQFSSNITTDSFLLWSQHGKPIMLLRSVTTSNPLYREISSQSLSVHLCVVAHPSYVGATHFFFEKEKSEPSQVVLLCCLALFIVSPLFNHVHVHVH